MDELKQAIETFPIQSTRDVANKVRCSQFAVQFHFKKLRSRSKLVGWAPQFELDEAGKYRKPRFLAPLAKLETSFFLLAPRPK